MKVGKVFERCSLINDLKLSFEKYLFLGGIVEGCEFSENDSENLEG